MEHAMMSPTSVKTNRAGFTLVEMLAVIGILALLAGILLPAVMRAMRTAERTKAAGLLQTISVGLEAYYNDHQQYPPIPANGMGPAMLGRALLAPGPAILSATNPPAYVAATPYSYGDVVQDGGAEFVCISATTVTGVATSTVASWQPFGYADGADGFGFRTRSTQGKTYAYLAPDRMKIRGNAILDASDSPILYYTARPGNPNPAATNGLEGTAANSLYNSLQAPTAFLSTNSMRYLLGDTSVNGQINAGETPATTGPYILWAAGPDGAYGISPVNATEAARCDDVTNFK